MLEVTVRGRDEVVERIAGVASSPDGLVRVLTGVGGSGKSTVAQAVAARVTAAGGRAWWVDADHAVVMRQSMLGLAGELGASETQIRSAMAGLIDPSDVLWGQLTEVSGWALILDNADDPSTLSTAGRPASSGRAWLRRSHTGLVLVTSRRGDQDAWGPVARVEQLDVLGDDDGAQVLLDLARHAGNGAGALSLTRRLGGIPLALRQAGAYLSMPFATERSYASYEGALTSRFGELMGRGDDDRARVTATWELSLNALESRAQGRHARWLLRILSCFACPTPVPSALFNRDILAKACGSLADVEDALSGLLSVSLIGIADRTNDAPSAVRVHPLVAETVRHRAGAKLSGPLGVAVELIAAAADRLGDTNSPDGARWLELLPHISAVLACPIRLSAKAEETLAFAAAEESEGLVPTGSCLAGLAIAESALNRAQDTLKSDARAILRLRSCRADALEFMGNWPQAEAEYRHLLADQARALGPNHPDVLAIRHSIAFVLHRQGRSAEAEAQYRDLLIDQARILGSDHPSILASRHNFAAALKGQGKLSEAETQYRQVLADRQRIFGAEDPRTLMTRNEIGRILALRGQGDDAEAELRSLLADRIRILGPNHPSTLTTRHLIAVSMAVQGRPGEAECEYRNLLPDQIRIMGRDHPYTLTIRHDLAAALADQGKTQEARNEYQQILADQLSVLGPNHPDTTATRAAHEHLSGGSDH